MNIHDMIKKISNESAIITVQTATTEMNTIEQIVTMISNAYKRGNKVLVFGNGGSAADAQHFVAELVGRFKRERSPLNAVALTVNTSIITAIGNDYGFDKIFSRQVEALASKDDIVIAISTSGNSPNILEGIREAARRGAHTIGLIGCNGGKLKDMVDCSLIVHSSSVPRIQEAHITIIHIICELVEKELFPHD